MVPACPLFPSTEENLHAHVPIGIRHFLVLKRGVDRVELFQQSTLMSCRLRAPIHCFGSQVQLKQIWWLKRNYLSEETSQYVSGITKVFFILCKTQAWLLLNRKLPCTFERWLNLQKFHLSATFHIALHWQRRVKWVCVHVIWENV